MTTFKINACARARIKKGKTAKILEVALENYSRPSYDGHMSN
jgi:hypothetical protein